MTDLEKLKSAATLNDVANLLGYKPKSLAYILYKKPKDKRYKTFEIPKNSCGMRTISAPYPDLKTLQKRLHDLLRHCINEINATKKISSALSHGFRRNYSIITNAAIHRNKRYVFNIDLKDFFGTINFGRVRGFFISNNNFNLNPKVATVLAQIACYNNALPQGSPSSPIVSNLIGHILDIRLASLAKKTSCSYSRYADDLTFSTNKRDFPKEIAKLDGMDGHQWIVGKNLAKIIKRSGFAVNESKTRMQYISSRQDVTGLVVNAKVNTRSEYRKKARAMVHRLINTGEFQFEELVCDEEGEETEVMVNGTLDQLSGILSFIDSVSVYNIKKDIKPKDLKKPLTPPEYPDSNERTYRSFLVYKNFHSPPKPVVVCEGKTDNIYLKAAIENLVESHPTLASKNKDGKIDFKIDFFKRNATTGRILGLGGGSGELKENLHIRAVGQKHPVILLIDNDDGAKGLYGYAKNIKKSKIDPASPFIHVNMNLYIVPTPLTDAGKDTMIEDFFNNLHAQTGTTKDESV